MQGCGVTDDEVVNALTAIAQSGGTNQDAQAVISRLLEEYAKPLTAMQRSGGLSKLARKVRDAASMMPTDGTAQARMHYAVTVLWEHGASW
jgi:hypothetical protein